MGLILLVFRTHVTSLSCKFSQSACNANKENFSHLQRRRPTMLGKQLSMHAADRMHFCDSSVILCILTWPTCFLYFEVDYNYCINTIHVLKDTLTLVTDVCRKYRSDVVRLQSPAIIKMKPCFSCSVGGLGRSAQSPAWIQTSRLVYALNSLIKHR